MRMRASARASSVKRRVRRGPAPARRPPPGREKLAESGSRAQRAIAAERGRDHLGGATSEAATGSRRRCGEASSAVVVPRSVEIEVFARAEGPPILERAGGRNWSARMSRRRRRARRKPVKPPRVRSKETMPSGPSVRISMRRSRPRERASRYWRAHARGEVVTPHRGASWRRARHATAVPMVPTPWDGTWGPARWPADGEVS